jgi:transcriptional regulator with XRE-family HTH domain
MMAADRKEEEPKERRVNPQREIGRIFESIRSELGYSQEQMAAKLGTSQAHLSRIESGAKRPSTALMDRLATKYGADRTKLFLLLQRVKGLAIDPESDQSLDEQGRVRQSRSTGYVPVFSASDVHRWVVNLEADDERLRGDTRMEYVGRKIAARSKVFLVETTGQAMTGGGIGEGDIVLVDPGAPLENGRKALIFLKSTPAIFVWREIRDMIVLTPLRDEGKEIVIPRSEWKKSGYQAFRITGVRTFREE